MIKKVGVVGVDSGQIMVCDPCYLDSSWQREDDSNDIIRTEVYKDKKTGRTYAYAGFGIEPDEADVLFNRWDMPLADYDGKTPNSCRETKLWELDHRSGEDRSGEFSYTGCCHITLGDTPFGQLRYPAGHAGAGVVSTTQCGDGCYPVFASIDQDGCVESLFIDFRVCDYDNAMTPDSHKALIKEYNG